METKKEIVYSLNRREYLTLIASLEQSSYKMPTVTGRILAKLLMDEAIKQWENKKS